MKRFLLSALAALVALAFAAALVIFLAGGAPSSERDWADDQAVQPTVTIAGSTVRIDSLRDFRHRPGGAYDPVFRTETFDTADVRAVWFALAPFADSWSGLAHTFVSFELEGGRYLSVSVEARREREESYTLLGGLTRRFEVTYVIGTESDLLGLRALRGDVLHLYPSKATPAQARAMLLDMLRRAQALRTSPEFYNTLTNNCATNLRAHVNRVSTERLPFGWAILFPGYSDELALERGLLATDLPLDRARATYRVDERARAALADHAVDFSKRIRQTT